MLKLDKLSKGDLIANVEYCTVTAISEDTIGVKNLESGLEFEISGRDLIESALSADQFTKTEKVTQTELAQKLTESYNRPFTVEFWKQTGEERKLRGYLLESEPLMGRSYCEDLYVAEKSRLRLVDHRTLKSLIVDGVKYILKGK